MTNQDNQLTQEQFVKQSTAVTGARKLLMLAKRRDALFPSQDLPDQSWPILLWLFIQHHEGKTATLEDIFAALKVPIGAGLRYLNYLANRNLIAWDEAGPSQLTRRAALSNDTVTKITDLLGNQD
jgi:hypothetical protein